MAAFCGKCGGELTGATKFCGICGEAVGKGGAGYTPMPAPAPNGGTEYTPMPAPAPKGGGPFDFRAILDRGRKFIVPAIAGVVVIILVIAGIMILKPDKYGKIKGEIYWEVIDGETVIVPNGKNPVKIDGRISKSSESLDGTKAAILVNENGNSHYEGYTLYLLTDRLQKIADEVNDAVISSSGDGIAFIKNYDSYDDTYELYLYSGGKTSTVTRSFASGIAISPNGKTVGYTADDGGYIGYYWDGREHKLGKDVSVVAIADGAKYVYLNRNGSFSVQRGDNEDRRVKLGDSTVFIYFNKNLSQVVYRSNSKTFISRNGGERTALSGSMSMLLVPEGTARANRILDISSFADTFYITGSDDIIRINGKFQADKIVGKVDGYSTGLAADGKTLIYRKKNNVYKVNGTGKNIGDAKPVIEGGVSWFIASSDGKLIYYATNRDSDELYCKSGNGKPQLVSNDIDSINEELFKGKSFYYTGNDRLYVSSGGKGAAVKDIRGEVQYVDVGYNYITVETDEGYYFSTDGSKFTSIGRK